MESTGRIVVPAGILASLAAEAVRARPGECCGALLGEEAGDGRRVRAVLPLPNAVAGGRYALTAESMREAEAIAREVGEEVLGFYHSHPRGAPEPSPLDREAAWPWYTYLIVAASTGSARAWRLAEDRSHFMEQALVVEDGP